MRILFYPVNCTPFHGSTLDEKPLGGLETATIRFARALQHFGHEVFVISPLKSPQTTYPIYLTAEEAWRIKNFDLMIGVRGWEAFWTKFKAKKKLLWTGDGYSNLHTFGLGDPRVYSLFDGLLCVSEWHRETLCKASGYPKERVHLLRNGIDLEEFSGHEARRRKRLIYTSNPQRGLAYLSLIFVRLKTLHPDLELHVFSNAALFSLEWPPIVSLDIPHFAFLDLMKKMPGCTVHGTVPQKQLARELMKSSILTYPTQTLETSCIAIMEAQAAGCCVVTSKLAALPETVGEGGILIDHLPGSEVYIEAYIEAVDRLLKDDVYLDTLSQKSIQLSLKNGWKNRAKEFLDWVNL